MPRARPRRLAARERLLATATRRRRPASPRGARPPAGRPPRPVPGAATSRSVSPGRAVSSVPPVLDPTARHADVESLERPMGEPVLQGHRKPPAAGAGRVRGDPDRRVHPVDVPDLRPRPVPGVEDPPVAVAPPEDARLGRVVVARPDVVGGRQVRPRTLAEGEVERDREHLAEAAPDHAADHALLPERRLHERLVAGAPGVTDAGIDREAESLARPAQARGEDRGVLVEDRRLVVGAQPGQVLLPRPVPARVVVAAQVGALGCRPAHERVLRAELVEVEREDGRPRRIHGTDEGQLGVEAAPPAALVAEVPDDHRGVSLVASDGLGGHVEQERDQLGGLVGPRPVVVVEPAREADRRLLDDEHPDLVADVEQVRARRVVRGPDHGDVRAPQVDDVLAHVVRRQRAALEDPRVVAIDAADADRGAVDEEPVALRLHPPEPDPPPVRLRLPRVPGDDDLEVVEHGLLGRPRAHSERSGLEPAPAAPGPVDRPARGAAPGDRALGVPDRRLELETSGLEAEVDGVHADLQRPGTRDGVPVRREVELAEVERRHGEQEDVPPDSEQRHVGHTSSCRQARRTACTRSA